MKVLDSKTEKFLLLVICFTAANGCFSSMGHVSDSEQETLSKEDSWAGLTEKMEENSRMQNGEKYRTAPDKIRFDDHPGLENVL